MLLFNHFTFLCFNCFYCLCMYLFSLWATIFNKVIVIIGHFRDESFQSITCTGTDNLTRTTKRLDLTWLQSSSIGVLTAPWIIVLHWPLSSIALSTLSKSISVHWMMLPNHVVFGFPFFPLSCIAANSKRCYCVLLTNVGNILRDTEPCICE